MAIKRIESYIVTDGNGKEAVEFYKEALNPQKVEVALYKDIDPDCSKEHENLIANAQIKLENATIMLSDENPNSEYRAGTNVTISLIVDSVQEAGSIYEKMTRDAKEISMELQETFWSPAYANFTDKYGVMWQLMAEVENPDCEYQKEI